MQTLLILITTTLFTSTLYAQNIGVGTETPSAPLHIKKTTATELLRIEGATPYISFFDNISGYGGYLWNNVIRMELGTPSSTTRPVVIAPGVLPLAYFTTNGRVGISNSNPSEKLDVNGNINFNGLLKVNGNSGLQGQVLTSNGAAAPQWRPAAYSNSVRFAVSFTKNASSSNDYGVFSLTRYNLSPADVVITAGVITINRSGLYHFDLQATGSMNFATAQTINPQFGCWLFTGQPNSFPILRDQFMTASSNANTGWQTSGLGSIEVYVSAPANIRVYHTFGFGGGT